MTAIMLAAVCLGAGAGFPAGTPIPFTDGSGPLFSYMPGPAPSRSYVPELFTPSGVNVVRDNVEDHIHHHGLMMAFKVDGTDFWSEVPEGGKQVRTALEKRADGLVENLDWTAPDGTVLLKETRTLRASRQDGHTLLDWTSEFSLPAGRDTAVITGSHYHGLGMRFIKQMDTQGPFFNESGRDGELIRGDERNTRADWCAYTAEIKGKPVTAAMFDHPDNFRPATWFTMSQGFAYLSATVNVWRDPLTLSKDAPLKLRYAVALWDGKTPPEAVAAAWANWTK